jgi:cupin 2 domain-containing protein
MNLFDLPHNPITQELCENLLPDHGVRIERIVSTGQASPPGFWYDQDRDEWVVLLQGQAGLAWIDGRKQTLKAGDWLLILAHERHRVEWTSQEPACIWLAVHARLV